MKLNLNLRVWNDKELKKNLRLSYSTAWAIIPKQSRSNFYTETKWRKRNFVSSFNAGYTIIIASDTLKKKGRKTLRHILSL